mgnify:CR=1 FL=1
MNLGPVEYAVIAFPGNRFNGDVVPALSELVDSGTVHIIDLVFVHKDADGILTIGELEQLDAELGAVFAELEGDIDGLLSEEDLSDISALLSDNSSAAVSYTHLTLPTSALVEISGGPVSLKKKRTKRRLWR